MARHLLSATTARLGLGETLTLPFLGPLLVLVSVVIITTLRNAPLTT